MPMTVGRANPMTVKSVMTLCVDKKFHPFLSVDWVYFTISMIKLQ